MSGSNGIRIILWMFLVIAKGAVVRGQTGGPNAVALIDGQAMLDCVVSVLQISSWTRTTDGTSDLVVIASGCSVIGNNSAYYRTEVQGVNICRLIIANVTMQQAGVYSCYDGLSTIYRSLITVIDPVANVIVHNLSAEVVNNDQLNISCSINYSGPSSPAPSLRPSPYWTTSAGQIFTSAIYHPSTTVVTLVATVSVQKPTVPIFQCKTVFEITGNTNGYNAIPPADNFTLGATTEIDIQYGPSSPTITSRPEVISINGVPCGISVLTCSSTGNPLPSYKWYDSAENDRISDEQTLTLAEVNRNYRCESHNTIRNVLYVESAAYIVSKNDSVSYLQSCEFPLNESTSISVTGCDNASVCVCSQGRGGLTLTCSAPTYPCASYVWTGTDENIIYSQVHEDISSNGTYYCTAYFDRALSNYTGNVNFPNGTTETFVKECSVSVKTSTTTTTTTNSMADSNINDVAIAMGVLFGISLAVIAILIIWMYTKLRAKQDPLKSKENVLPPEMTDLSNGTSEPSAYEELRQPGETRLQQTTYEKLTPNTTSYADPNSPCEDITHNFTLHSGYANRQSIT